MVETDFLALTYVGQYVNGFMLNDGIYTSIFPTLFDKNFTHEQIIDLFISSGYVISDSFRQNLFLCNLTPVKIIQTATVEQI